MHILSDEQVLMAYLYHGGLSKDQQERREQCKGFNALARRAIEEGDAAMLRGLVERVNANQAKDINGSGAIGAQKEVPYEAAQR
jgi:hypothetical protein